ncbi:MAG TPA: type I 3-dehydroquinate dehydratase [Candidatus Saccharimonadales bacterium]|nr:type I 3-dehydroquinate dehydratase [Candidatus Saccharimonadales bacterium]
MREKYCLPVIKHSTQAVFDEIDHNIDQYHFFEVWLDYIEGVDDEFVTKLTHKYSHKIIFLFRRERLEPIEMPSDSRFQLIRSLDQSHALLDLDIRSQLAELEFIKLNDLQIRVIGSYHNYKKTPDLNELQLIVDQIESHKPEIVKISTFCNDEEDAVRLLELQLLLKEKHQKHIVLGMGRHGIVTRIFGSLWGNELIFAPLVAQHHTAPGQLSRAQLDTIFKNLHI